MAVYERGSFRERRRDQARRVLVLGVGLINGFWQNAFRAALAHEYGHFAHRDTAGGDVALRVNQDIMQFGRALLREGQAVWWNIAFQFLRVYHFIFRRIGHGATRLQEVLADRVAARIYGADSFEEGLRHVVRRQIEFDYLATKEIEEAAQVDRALQNLYSLEARPESAVEDAIQQALTRQTSEDDTHPCPLDRFRLASRVVGPSQPAARGLLWDLFANREALTREMSSTVEGQVTGATV